MPDGVVTGISINDVLAYLSIGGTLLLAGRVVFSTEASVKTLDKESTAHTAQLNALLTTVSENKAAQAALVERVNSVNISMETKASIESVAAVREAVESLRREQDAANKSVIQHLVRIESKVDRTV